MQILDWQKLSSPQKKDALSRPPQTDATALRQSVTDIVRQVKEEGDAALRRLSLAFDGRAPDQFRVQHDAGAAARACAPQLRAALEQAKANIETFHHAEKPHEVVVETMPGVRCELQWRALDTVGLYIPGGTAPLLSTVLMLALPAKLAGCRRVVLCTPAPKGEIHEGVLAAADICGIDEIYAVGGAQAIAAMAFGTASIPKVDKIFGPGNAYVTLAKQLVAQDADGAAIDMPAGPSEVMVIAEPDQRADFVAADLLAQAEHDSVAQAVLVTTDRGFAEKVKAEVARQLPLLSRHEIAGQSMKHARLIIARDDAQAIEIANLYAPEHLLLQGPHIECRVADIAHAGSVFVGAFTPESAGDYASGTNHVLPTYGYARAYNGVNLLSFMKSMSVQHLSEAGLRALSSTLITLAEAEGLTAHAEAVKIRVRKTP